MLDLYKRLIFSEKLKSDPSVAHPESAMVVVSARRSLALVSMVEPFECLVLNLMLNEMLIILAGSFLICQPSVKILF